MATHVQLCTKLYYSTLYTTTTVQILVEMLVTDNMAASFIAYIS